jgi:hypothetical protein
MGLITLDSLPKNGVVNEEHKDGTEYSDKEAIQIYATDALRSEEAEDPSPDYGSNDSENNVQEETFT